MIQNFDNGYTQDTTVNADATIDFSGKKIQFELLNAASDAYCGKDFGAGSFGEFIHTFKFNLSRCDLDATWKARFWMACYSDEIGDYSTINAANGKILGIQIRTTGSNIELYAVSFDGTSISLGTGFNISLDTDYYVKITRTHDTDIFTVDVYSDKLMTQLVGTDNKSGLGDDYKFFKYFLPYMSYDTATLGTLLYSGVIEDYDLDPSCRYASTINDNGQDVLLHQAIYGTRDSKTGQPAVTWVDPQEIKAIIYFSRTNTDTSVPQRGIDQERWIIQTSVPLTKSDRIEWDGEIWEIDNDSRGSYMQGKRLMWLSQMTKMELVEYV